MFCIVFKSKKWYCLFWHRYCTILKVHLTQITCRDRRWCRCSSVKAWTTGFSRGWHPQSSKCKRLMAPPLWMRHAFSFSHLHFHGCWLQFNSQTWTVVNRCTWQSPVQPDAVLQNLTYSLSVYLRSSIFLLPAELPSRCAYMWHMQLLCYMNRILLGTEQKGLPWGKQTGLKRHVVSLGCV